MTMDNIRVFVRVRPPENLESSDLETQCLEVDSARNAVIMNCKPEQKVFTYDQVADIETTQEFVFTNVGKNIIESALKGYNGTIFAYGQTGSGKSFTMLGPQEDNNIQHDWRGVIPRTFGYLFSLIEREQQLKGENVEFLVRCSFLEIYNEQIFDLLEPSAMPLHLRENIKHGVYVENLTEVTVKNSMESYEALIGGMQNRRVAATSMNRESSRSHAVFTIHIESKQKNEGLQNIRLSRLHLVDLAGSERQKDTNTAGQRLKEAGSINKSLSVLGHVIMSLVDIAQGKDRYVPYRDSKLSFLLRDSLGGNAMTCIIACIHPSSRCFGETLSTLHFARRAKMIKNKAIINEDTQGNIAHLQNEIRRLKEQIAQMNMSPVVSKGVNSSSHIIMPSSRDHEEMENWKRKFIEAMHFRDKSEQEKQTLKAKSLELEDLVRKKERFLQNQKMIVKFKESRIAQLEKNVKEIDSQLMIVCTPTSQLHVNSMKEEIECLKDNLQHNPKLTQIALEKEHLRNEVKRLRSIEAVATGFRIEREKMNDLEKVYTELMQEKGDGDNNNVISDCRSCTPQASESVSVATIERYESQIRALQEEINNLKEETRKSREETEKRNVDLQSELTSFQKANSELEKVLEAHQLKSRMEIDSMNNMHLHTIQTFTTPTKLTYSLRNRDIHRKSLGGPIEMILEEEDNIFDEKELPEMAEQAKEALTEEIKRLQEQSSSLQEQFQAMESENLKLRQTHSKHETKIEQLNEILESERSSFKTLNDSLTKQVDEITKDLNVTKSHESVLKEEVQDLKLLLGSSDNELKAAKCLVTVQKTTMDKEVASLETELSRLKDELSKMNRDRDIALEEKGSLVENLDTAHATLSFFEDEMKELEKKLLEERVKVKNLHVELQNAAEKQQIDDQNYARLLEQITQQGEDKEKEFAKHVEENKMLRDHLYSIQQQYEEKSGSLIQSNEQIEKLREEQTLLQKMSREQQELLSQLGQRSQDQNSRLNQQDRIITDLHDEIEGCHKRTNDLENVNEKIRRENEALRQQFNESEAEFTRKINVKEVEICIYKDELEDMSSQYSVLQESSAMTDIQRQQTLEELQESKKQIEQLKHELLQKSKELEEFERTMQARSLDHAETKQTAEELHLVIQRNSEEFAKYKISQTETLKKHIEEFETVRKDKNKEIEMLKMQLSENETLRSEYEKLEIGCKVLEREQRLAVNREQDMVEKLTDLQMKYNQLEASFSENSMQLVDQVKEKESMQNELAVVNVTLETLRDDLQIKQTNLERISDLAAHDQEKISGLMSLVEEMKEEKAKTLKHLENVKAENAKLVGHQNLNQKIHYVSSLQQEKNKLQEENMKLKIELNKLKKS
ncbi:kinesin-like protein KIF15 [Tubulanus polymorphus]|uniref:kinesin-like protein KIF15 n=1 Tax=Tubulanus polymorphus TaxID=672921 RepID=UPI003DA1F4E3